MAYRPQLERPMTGARLARAELKPLTRYHVAITSPLHTKQLASNPQLPRGNPTFGSASGFGDELHSVRSS